MNHCRDCRHFRPPEPWKPEVGRCALAEGAYSDPVRESSPMWANGNDGYLSWLHVRPDHGCNAWDGPFAWVEEDGDLVQVPAS